MNISLTPELERLIHDKVATGMYTSASEVVRDGLRLLKERDEMYASKLRELRKALKTGEAQLARGEGKPAKVVMERLKRKYRGKAE